MENFSDLEFKTYKSRCTYRSAAINTTKENIVIQTLEGVMLCCPGDYIVIGIKGETYPCKPGIFLECYEEAPNNE